MVCTTRKLKQYNENIARNTCIKKIPRVHKLQRRKKMAGNRQYKSDVFSMLLEDPKNALEVFNGVNGTDYDDPSKVEIHLLDKGVSLSIYNDASFILDMNLSLYEHQSTYNPNIPLRNLIYLANLLQKLVILEEFLKSRREEVVKMTQLDYTWERREELIRREEYEEGLLVGTQQNILSLLNELGTVPNEICQTILGVTDKQCLNRLLKLAAKTDSFDEYKKRMEDILNEI